MKKEGTKQCKYCKTEIPADAKICPQCRKKQKGGKGKIIVIVLAILIVIGVLAGGNDENEESSDASVGTEQAEVSDETSTGTEQESETTSTIGVGESFESNDLKVTIDSYNENYTEHSEYFAPGDGNKYIEVGFSYENLGDSDQYVSIYDCTCYADNTSCEQAYIGDEDFINANISSGRNVSFKVYYEVPESANEIELEYDTSFWDSEKVVIKLQ